MFLIFPVSSHSTKIGPVRPDGKQAISLYDDGVQKTFIADKNKVDAYLNAEKDLLKAGGKIIFPALGAFFGACFAAVQDYASKSGIISGILLGASAIGLGILTVVNAKNSENISDKSKMALKDLENAQ